MRLPCMFWLKDNTKVEVTAADVRTYVFTYTFVTELKETKLYELKKTASGFYCKSNELLPYEREALEIFSSFI
jgi:hypothetical protein